MRFLRQTTVVSVLLLSLNAHAQVQGELKGRVLDASGAIIREAQVTLTQAATGVHWTTVTSSDGLYDFPSLVSGKYDIRVLGSGFATYQQTGITIQTGSTAGVDITLPASANEAVTVNADAPSLQSQTSDIQTTIHSAAVQALPLNTRNFVQLAQLAPGVALPPGTLLPRINGGRPRTNEYLFDGISALQPEPGQVAFFPILDSIAEFTIQANNVPAEFGRFNGGVVNAATRSGSNQWHGSLFEYLRNESLNARNYFASPTARKPMYRRNLVGATLGAPILHDRLFFFGDYQGVLQRIGVTRISTVPTVAQRAGNFSGVAKIYDPATTQTVNGRITRAEFPSDTINRPLDPAAVALLARYPLPTSSSAANNYTRVANDDDHQQQFDIRVDGAAGAHDRAFARYTFYHEVEQPATPLPDGSGAISGSVLGAGNVAGLTHITGQQVVLNQTHTFSSRVVNNVRLGYTRRGNTQTGTTLPGGTGNTLGIPGIPSNAAFNNALPLFSITGFTQLGQSASTFARYQTSVGELVDTVQWVKGGHSIKAGMDLRRYESNAIAPPNPTGSFSFTTTGTNTTTAAPATATSTGGNALASFLLGQVDTFSIDLQQRTIRPRDYIHEFFLQDDFHLTANLVINAGLRWTLHLPSTEAHNQGAVFNLATQQLDYLGVNGTPRSARELHWNNVAPRFGLAYSPDTKTVVRSGFGIVFNDQSGITTPFTTPQYPFIQNVQQKTQDSYNAAFPLSNGPKVQPIPLTPNAGFGQSVYTATRKAGSGYVQQWNLAVQRSLTNNLSFEVAYVGSHIVHVGIPDSNLNQLTPAQLGQGSVLTQTVNNPYPELAGTPLGTAKLSNAQLLKPYPRFQNVSIYRNNTGTTNYNALQAKVEQRMSHNLSLLLGYTHSKLIDDASSVFSSTVLSSPNSSSLIAADTFRPYLERDASNGDMPNVLTVSSVYLLPAFQGHGVATSLLGGWNIQGIFTMQSGMPVTVTQATNTNSFAGVALMRPTVVPNQIRALPAEQRSVARWFNTAAFAITPQFAFGNASRNPVRGPAYRDLDLSFIKHTRLSEHTDLEFRAELFNGTNTPGFAQPNGSFGTAAFGSITATVTDPRVAQFALRISR